MYTVLRHIVQKKEIYMHARQCWRRNIEAVHTISAFTVAHMDNCKGKRERGLGKGEGAAESADQCIDVKHEDACSKLA